MADSNALKTAILRAAEQKVLSAEATEHISLGSDEDRRSQAAPEAVRERRELRNAIRGVVTELTLYEEGFLKVIERRKGRRIKAHRLDLRYLDSLPSFSRRIAKRSVYTAAGCAAAAVLAALLGQFETLRPFAWPIAGAAMIAAGGALFVALYRSYEKIQFCTLHGRAPVLTLIANIGCIHAFRALVPWVNQAIEDASEYIGTDTQAFLRAEMREHYRLRGEGLLKPECVSDSTGRILAQFDNTI